MTAARTLASGRTSRNWLAVALVVSVAINIATPVYYSIQAHHKDEVVVFDLASGTLLLSPMVDPADSTEILDTLSTWDAKCVLDRSPVGLDNDPLVSVLFNSDMARKAREEFAGVKQQYIGKSLRSHVEIKSIDAQAVGNGIIKSRVIGQVLIDGTVNGSAIQEVQPVIIDFSLVRNPDLSRVRRYPFVVFSYAYGDTPVAKK